MNLFFVIAILFSAYFTIEGATEYNIFKAGFCLIVTVVLIIIARGYDGYKNTGVWFG